MCGGGGVELDRIILQTDAAVDEQVFWCAEKILTDPDQTKANRSSSSPQFTTQFQIENVFTKPDPDRIVNRVSAFAGHAIRSIHLSLVMRKPVFGVFDKVRHKLGCTATEDG